MRVLVFVGLLLASPAALAGSLESARQSGVLRVGTPGDYAPYSLHEADGS